MLLLIKARPTALNIIFPVALSQKVARHNPAKIECVIQITFPLQIQLPHTTGFDRINTKV